MALEARMWKYTNKTLVGACASSLRFAFARSLRRPPAPLMPSIGPELTRRDAPTLSLQATGSRTATRRRLWTPRRGSPPRPPPRRRTRRPPPPSASPRRSPAVPAPSSLCSRASISSRRTPLGPPAVRPSAATTPSSPPRPARLLLRDDLRAIPRARPRGGRARLPRAGGRRPSRRGVPRGESTPRDRTSPSRATRAPSSASTPLEGIYDDSKRDTKTEGQERRAGAAHQTRRGVRREERVQRVGRRVRRGTVTKTFCASNPSERPPRT